MHTSSEKQTVGVSCPRTSYSRVNCPWEESWGRDSLLQMGTAYSEVTCPRGTGCSGVKSPRTTYSGVNGPGGHCTPWTVSYVTGVNKECQPKCVC